MKYVNAADVLPQELLEKISQYAGGKLLYVPAISKKCAWGEKNGSKQYYRDRNQKIKMLYQQGKTVEELSKLFFLSNETVRKIISDKWSNEGDASSPHFIWLKMVIPIFNLELKK